MSRVKLGVVPPSGWHFPVGPKQTAPVISAESLDRLEELVRQYRIDNSIKIGRPDIDIEKYICGNWPHYCIPVDQLTKPQLKEMQEPVTKPLIERVLQWVSNRYSLGGTFALVPQSEAIRRASICSQCPQNREWRTNCGPCNEQVERHSLLVRQNATTPFHRRLLGCSAAGHDNQTAIWLKPKQLQHRKHYPLPSNCWMNDLPPL